MKETSRDIPNLSIAPPDSATDLDFNMQFTTITGVPRKGDSVIHYSSGRKFRVAERIWQVGSDRQENLVIRLEDAE